MNIPPYSFSPFYDFPFPSDEIIPPTESQGSQSSPMDAAATAQPDSDPKNFSCYSNLNPFGFNPFANPFFGSALFSNCQELQQPQASAAVPINGFMDPFSGNVSFVERQAHPLASPFHSIASQLNYCGPTHQHAGFAHSNPVNPSASAGIDVDSSDDASYSMSLGEDSSSDGENSSSVEEKSSSFDYDIMFDSEDEMISADVFRDLQSLYEDLFRVDAFKETSKMFDVQIPCIDQDRFFIAKYAKSSHQERNEHPALGTASLGPCVAICARAKDKEGDLFLGIGHNAIQDPETAFECMVNKFKECGCDKESVEFYLIGGGGSMRTE